MDFPQKIAESFGERAPLAYDVIMESPLYAATIERKTAPTVDKMSSSMNSTLDDTTPSDSGVQLLDSESSELMIESITSQTGFEFEEPIKNVAATTTTTPSAVVDKEEKEVINAINIEETTIVDNNSNVTATIGTVDDIMTTSACSTFDTTEQIVYRRKARKTPTSTKTPKKRVSFHEDILKNTRTDNIHIEHGFITYKSGGRKLVPQVGAAGRYSWCSEGDNNAPPASNELYTQPHEGGAGDAEGANQPRRRIVYRNACSDVLDYGNSDIYDTNESNALQYDNSGVFEYVAQEGAAAGGDGGGGEGGGYKMRQKDGTVLYRCSCSGSDSSLDSDENDKNSNRQQYGQAKSSSCDCIGMSNANNNIIGDQCYFSEPNIDNLNESPRQKSVWNKEKKPKSSCLKKSKRHTNIIHEHDLNTKVKKFNVHDMNQLLDNSSKMIFGSLKSIFTMPLPERGVPEGSEDLQSVVECVPELEQTPEHKPHGEERETFLQGGDSPPMRAKPFLSKSLDGSKQQQGVKKFVHNVDEQLRRKNDDELFAPTRQSSAEQQADKKVLERQDEICDVEPESMVTQQQNQQFRNKFIINCESTVFEHTGVSYCYESNSFNALCNVQDTQGSIASLIEKDTPIAQPEPDQLRNTFISAAPIAKTFSNFFRSFKETTSPTSNTARIGNNNNNKQPTVKEQQTETFNNTETNMLFKASLTSSTVSETSTTNNIGTMSTMQKSTTSISLTNSSSGIGSSNSLAIGQDLRGSLEKQSRHLPSPLKKRGSAGGLLAQQPQRYGMGSMAPPDNSLLSPDLFNGYGGTRGSSGRDSKSTILSDDFDDILTITTDTDKNESDIVIVDYSELSDRQIGAAGGSVVDYGNLLKPPQPPAAKTSLINRFLRNVTQKKILEASIRKNNFFSDKLKNEQKLFTGNLYVPGVRPKNYELIDDLNAEIAMEIEMSGANSPRRELVAIEGDLPGDISSFELGIGEISIDIFNGNYLHILRDATETLMKVFKLYTGYSREGYMTPVLVFLTDKTLYVTDLVRNRLCSKFVLAYADLDVILMGPYGNTVLLSNSTRDMQQVLLAGGPYPADGLVANLELCARRSGSTLPAVGQLTLAHLSPLQTFVREHSSVSKEDVWLYYAVVNVPAGTLGTEKEPLGPHVKGFLMHRRLRDATASGSGSKQNWKPGYFLLKAGVLYMFNDSSQKLPSWAMALAECQGARRAAKAGRPHCFEIMLKGAELLQLAAPDEYVASEWLQALLQSASGLFEMQEKHKTLGCTLVVTQHHLITLREDFNTPLRQLNRNESTPTEFVKTILKDIDELQLETSSLLSSAMSTPTRGTQRSCSSMSSTPTKLSQLSRSTNNTITSHTTTSLRQLRASSQPTCPAQLKNEEYNNMSSVYGKNSGLEILTCADIKEMTGIKVPSHNDTWWCVLEFSCQEVRECSDDLVIFFASSSEMQRFLRLLEQLWQAKNNDLFPITVLDEDDVIAEQCSLLYMDINRSWEPLLSAALGYPL